MPGEEITIECRYFIVSLENNAEQLGKAVRKHWGIEKGLHWMLPFREGENRVRKDNGAKNMAILRQEATLRRSISSLNKPRAYYLQIGRS